MFDILANLFAHPTPVPNINELLKCFKDDLKKHGGYLYCEQKYHHCHNEQIWHVRMPDKIIVVTCGGGSLFSRRSFKMRPMSKWIVKLAIRLSPIFGAYRLFGSGFDYALKTDTQWWLGDDNSIFIGCTGHAYVRITNVNRLAP